MGDLAFRGGVGEDFLVPPATAELYDASRLTGIDGFERVEIVRAFKAHVPPPSCVHVSVRLNGAALDESRSALIRSDEVAPCDRCMYRGTIDGVHGFRIDPDT